MKRGAHSDDPPSFANLLRLYRRNAGLTQVELAERAQMSAKAISALERGVNLFPHRDSFRLIGNALQLSAEQWRLLEAFRPTRQTGRTVSVSHTSSESDLAHIDEDNLSPLVGRGKEIRALKLHLLGQGMVALAISGEPGIGKSSLLKEAARLAHMHGMVVIQGGCRRRRGQEPYSAILNAFDESIRCFDTEQVRKYLKGCGWMTRLLPELGEEGLVDTPVASLRPDQERRLIFRAVSRYISNLAEGAKILLLLDDMQWADHDSLDLLEYLAEVAPETGLRLVIAYRDTEIYTDSPLSTSLENLVHQGLIAQIELRPLDNQASFDLIHRTIGKALETDQMRSILHRTGGVPFFLLSEAIEQDVISTDAKLKPSWTVAQSIRQRLRILPTSAQQVIEVAAVLGRNASLSALFFACARFGIQHQTAYSALDTLCKARLLVTESGAYLFAHDTLVSRKVVP
jgi:predicted ATPase/DNA-binding XRE family transcriptional regulator